MPLRLSKDWLEDFMIYTEDSEPPNLYREWVGVSVIASFLRRKCYLKWGHLIFYPNMYIILVGPSGTRKGVAMSFGEGFLEEKGIKLAAESITREALIRELRETNYSDIKDDGTVELHSSLTIFSKELTVFLGYDNKQLMMDLTDWYDCKDRWTYRTKNKGTDEIMGVWVNLIGATTPQLIQSAMPMDAIGGGLTGRMIFVHEERKSKTVADPHISENIWKVRDMLSQDLDHIGATTGEFKVTPGFLENWMEWYPEQDRNPPFKDLRFEGYLSRRPTHLMKLAMVMNVSRCGCNSDGTYIIDTCDFNKAVSLLTRTEKNMPKTFMGVGRSDLSDVFARVMTFIGTKDSLHFSDVMSFFYMDVSKEELVGIIATLVSMKFCSCTYHKIGEKTEMIINYVTRTERKKDE